jgi:hypothetical protein
MFESKVLRRPALIMRQCFEAAMARNNTSLTVACATRDRGERFATAWRFHETPAMARRKQMWRAVLVVVDRANSPAITMFARTGASAAISGASRCPRCPVRLPYQPGVRYLRNRKTQ